MGLAEQIAENVDSYLNGDYDVRDGRVVPSIDNIKLGKFGIRLEATIFYIDFRRSSKVVDAVRRQTAAKMYKSYLYAVSKVVRENDGEIRNFTGDGLLALFIGGAQSTSAVTAAMKTDYALTKIVKPKLTHYFEANASLADVFQLDYGIGVAQGEILAVKVGIPGTDNNNLIWLGNATNFAAKMADEGKYPYNTLITHETFQRLHDSRKVDRNGNNQWFTHNMSFADETHEVLKTNQWLSLS
jgi:class 3 adenylate cyclase